MDSILAPSIPKPLRHFFSLFPVYTHGPVASPYTAQPVSAPTLWIHPPRNESPELEDLLSSDVECLKWQAFLALRGLSQVYVRWDVAEDGALDSRLPNLHVPSEDGEPGGELLAAHLIPEWADGKVGGGLGELEGYVNEAARDESRAWVSLMEGNVHAALVRFLLVRTVVGARCRTVSVGTHAARRFSSRFPTHTFPRQAPRFGDHVQPTSSAIDRYQLTPSAVRHACRSQRGSAAVPGGNFFLV